MKETRVKTGQVVGDSLESTEGTLVAECFSTCLMVNSHISLLCEPCFVLQRVKKEDFQSHAG